jgi:hypothetical protein
MGGHQLRGNGSVHALLLNWIGCIELSGLAATPRVGCAMRGVGCASLVCTTTRCGAALFPRVRVVLHTAVQLSCFC